MDVSEKAAALVSHIRSLSDFEISKTLDGNYDHMGATIVDAMLQPGVKYAAVVKPRVEALREQHPEARTTSGFLKLLKEEGAGSLLDWKGEKPKRIWEVTRFFSQEGIETEADLRQWLQEANNIEKLKQLRGIGRKTTDYFKILVGLPVVAIDRRLLAFLHAAKIEVSGYGEAQQIVEKAADLMRVNRGLFDHSIWKYKKTKEQYECP